MFKFKRHRKDHPIEETSTTVPPPHSRGNTDKTHSTSSYHQGRGRCAVCHTLLEYPESVKCFECTICRVVTDLKIVDDGPLKDPASNTVSQLGFPPYLTYSNVRQMAAKCKETRDFHKMGLYLKHVFSSVQALCQSFFVVDDQGHPTLYLEDIRKTYAIIAECPPEIVRIVVEGIESVLERPGRRFNREEELRFFIILLENPLFYGRWGSNIEWYERILAMLFGYASNLPAHLLRSLVEWLSILPADNFRNKVEMCNLLISYLLNSEFSDLRRPYSWRLVSAVRFMALLFASNELKARLSIAEFYNTRIDAINIFADYEFWQRNTGDFCLCQYPFIVSLGRKMDIMEADAQRQMEREMKDALLAVLYRKRFNLPFLILRVRRDHLIEDSLNQISTRKTELKKKLKIEFVHEDGVDAGGISKEWFLMLTRELFHPQYGMFQHIEESNFFWFNPASLESEEDFYLVGATIGLAIYNSTILDVHFPLCCYKKLLGIKVDFNDLKEFMPTLAQSFQILLEFEGDVENSFCRDFVANYDQFGVVQTVPLKPGGEKLHVDRDNRQEFVRLYVDFLLNKSIERQFAAFRQGFLDVCGGNALTLFRPEEIEMMVCGSHEIDLHSLEAVTTYEGFRRSDRVIRDFWEIANNTYSIELKQKLLLFVTGTDRMPATGSTKFFKISRLGRDSIKLPIAHTCFNQLCLWDYASKQKLYHKLTQAITESSGFNLK